MSLSPNENDDVLARIRNPVVDAWNDASDDRSASTLQKPASAGFQPHRAQPLPSQPMVATPVASPSPAPAYAPPQAKPIPRLMDSPPRASMTPRSVPATQAQPAAASAGPTATRFLTPVLTILAGYACLSGFFDLMGSAVPGAFSNPNWRFGAVGAAAPTLVKPVIGAALATIALILSERRLLSQLVMWTLVLIGLGMLAVVPLFVLDGLQVRPGLPSSMSGRVLLVNVAFALSFMVMGALVLFTCAWSLRKAVRSWATNENVAVEAWDR